MPMTRAAIYARVSTEEQVEGYSIAAQLRALREYAPTLGLGWGNSSHRYRAAGHCRGAPMCGPRGTGQTRGLPLRIIQVLSSAGKVKGRHRALDAPIGL